MTQNSLIIFVKAPRPGFVKTRLAAAIGPGAAAAAYRQLVETLLQSLSASSLPDTNVELCFTPDDARAEITPWLRAGWAARPQGSGDLGERMHRALEAAFGSGAGRAAIIGSDCPGVSGDDIVSTWLALNTCDLVLGPATDGGYWLIGLDAPQRPLFDGIHWSTAEVADETRRRAAALGLSVHLLGRRTDIDTVEQWQLLQQTPFGTSHGGRT